MHNLPTGGWSHSGLSNTNTRTANHAIYHTSLFGLALIEALSGVYCKYLRCRVSILLDGQHVHQYTRSFARRQTSVVVWLIIPLDTLSLERPWGRGNRRPRRYPLALYTFCASPRSLRHRKLPSSLFSTSSSDSKTTTSPQVPLMQRSLNE